MYLGPNYVRELVRILGDEETKVFRSEIRCSRGHTTGSHIMASIYCQAQGLNH